MLNGRINLLCVECLDEMQGIKSHGARDFCEGCGGNKTPFHKNNPWDRVAAMKWKREKQLKKEATA